MYFKKMYLVYNGYCTGYYSGRTYKEDIELTDIVGIIENLDDKEKLILQFDGNLNRIDEYCAIPILIPNNKD